MITDIARKIEFPEEAIASLHLVLNDVTAKGKLSALYDVGMIASLEVITAREYEHTIDPATDDTPEFDINKESFVLYRWQNGTLTAVHRKELTYYEESDIYCYAIFDLNEYGEWETTRESWVTDDRYDSKKYPMDASGYQGYVAN